jgi:hypothetical protein
MARLDAIRFEEELAEVAGVATGEVADGNRISAGAARYTFILCSFPPDRAVASLSLAGSAG